jgi:hypothetical protein
MKSEAQKRSLKKADKKSMMFAVKYREKELINAIRLKKYLQLNELSANSYLKELIKRDLDAKKIEYPDISDLNKADQ